MRFRLIAVAAACGIVASACGSSSSPTSPSTTGTSMLSALLAPANETPPVTNADSTGSGQVVVTLNTTKDSGGNVTGATATFQVTLSGFPAGTTLTGAHIHPGPAGTAGAVAVSTGLASGEVVLTNGSGSFTKSGVVVPLDVTQGLLTNAGAYYFNVHTSLNPGGAARGQLTRTQ